MDHDFHKLDEASDKLGCTVTDLLKWGAAGKIELCIWYEGRDHWHRGEVPCPLSPIKKLIPISKEDSMKAYQESKLNPRPGNHREVTLKYKDHPPMLIPDGPFSLAPESLYISKETFDTLKAKLLKRSTESATPFLDENHPFHAKELKTAIEAWTALFEKKEAGDPLEKIKSKPGGANSAIKKWLEKSYPDKTNNAYERIVRVINPFKTGGAPKRTE